jgi:aldehyde:ferredoxin oxidoreductase
MEGCFACPIRCKKIVQFDEPYHVDADYGGPEYETLAALGSNCGIDNLKAILKANERCNAYSLDTISMGGSLAFAMECFERGLLTEKDTGGIKLEFGDADVMLEAIELTARRQGLGALLAEGSARMAKKIGGGSIDFAMQVKGLENGMHEPRLKRGLGLGYMVNPHGGDHVLNMHDDGWANDFVMAPMNSLGLLETLSVEDIGPRKVVLFKFEQHKQIITDSLLICSFVVLPVEHQFIVDITEAVTGWRTSVTEQLRAAERILTVCRLFNVDQGLTAAADQLPKRCFQPKTNGVLSEGGLDPEKMDKAKKYYYHLMGWDPDTGIPMSEKMEELNIL